MPDAALSGFYMALKAGITAADLQINIYPTIEGLDSDLTPQLRSGSGETKRLVDEVLPVAYWAKTASQPDDKIEFPFDYGPIDCIVHRNGSILHRIQITISQGRARAGIAKLLNADTPAAGFVDLVDGDEEGKVEKVMSRSRIMFVAQQPRDILVKSVRRCLAKKKDPKGSDILIVAAQLHSLPDASWQQAIPALSKVAASSMFKQVFVVGRGRKDPLCFQIK